MGEITIRQPHVRLGRGFSAKRDAVRADRPTDQTVGDVVVHPFGPETCLNEV